MRKFAATNCVIPDRIKKRMSSRRVSPLAMGVNPLLLLKETEERDQPREVKNVLGEGNSKGPLRQS